MPIPRIWVVLEIRDPGYTEVMVSAVKDCAHGIDLVTLHFRSTFSEGRSCVEPHTDVPISVVLIRHIMYAVQCADAHYETPVKSNRAESVIGATPEVSDGFKWS